MAGEHSSCAEGTRNVCDSAKSLIRTSRFPIAAIVLAAAMAASGPAASATSIQAMLDKHVAANDLPGAIVIASRQSHLRVSAAAGVSDPTSKTPLNAQTVIWLASMSKPITAVSILMLAEQGKLHLEDPVSKYIPEFSAPTMVRVRNDGEPLKAGPPSPPGTPSPPMPDMHLIPASRSITIKDLLTHTSGLQTIGVPNDAVPAIAPGDTLATWVRKLAQVPLDFQPGSKWGYSNAVGFDVLSRIVEVTSGETFDHFVKAHIFTPLGISTIGFRGQLTAYAERMPPIPAPLSKDERIVGNTFFSGAAGMYGSLDDYRRFAEMLAYEGKGPYGRLLKASSIAAMRSNNAHDLFHSLNNRDDVNGVVFGYAVAVVVDPAAAQISVPKGSFGWDGAGGTRFWVSPREKTVEVLFVPKPAVRSEVEGLLQTTLFTDAAAARERVKQAGTR
jgi:CubicO group peptidase (beta-lactamase class C family)